MFLIFQKVKLIEKKKFVAIVFDSNYKVFIVYIATFNINFNVSDKIYLLKKT